MKAIILFVLIQFQIIKLLNGNLIETIMDFFKKEKTDRIFENEINTDLLILLPTKIGFDDGVNRLSLLGKHFPLIQLKNGQFIDFYTYICINNNDEICKWNKFFEMISNNNTYLKLKYEVEDLKLFHSFIVCESLQGQHESCPNPCLERELCLIHGSQSKCIITFWGLYKSDYMCTCLENQVWDDNLKKCLYYDPCFWKAGISCSDDSNNCLQFDDGSYNCVSNDVYKQHTFKKCKYKCESKIKDDCILQLSYFHHKIQHEDQVCGAGECVVDDSTKYGYYCKCELGWIDDVKNKYPDCSINTNTGCYDTRFDCVNGICEWDEVKSIYFCKCKQGYEGESCERPKAQWLLWGEWTSCHAGCNEIGIRIRSRECNVDKQLCRKPKINRKFLIFAFILQ